MMIGVWYLWITRNRNPNMNFENCLISVITLFLTWSINILNQQVIFSAIQIRFFFAFSFLGCKGFFPINQPTDTEALQSHLYNEKCIDLNRIYGESDPGFYLFMSSRDSWVSMVKTLKVSWSCNRNHKNK